MKENVVTVIVKFGMFAKIETLELIVTIKDCIKMSKKYPGCEDCWHNYHCPMPQEGYDYDPATCPYNPDNEKQK